MKKILSCILVVSFIFFYGCASKSIDISEMDEMEILDSAIDQLNTANSIEWDSISYSCYQHKEDEIVNTSYGDCKYIRKPFAQWAKSAMNQETSFETFGEEKNGELLWSIRDNNPDAEPVAVYEAGKKKSMMEPLIWNTSSIAGSQKDAFISSLEMKFSALAFFLSSNVGSFTQGKDTLDGVACIKYNGHITPETVLDYHEEFGRNIYVQLGMLEKKEGMLRDDLYNEIINAANTPPYELAVGLNVILFSDNPSPVSIWINAKTGAVMNIKIDFTEATANQTKIIDTDNQTTYIENFTEYRNIVFNRIKTLKRPD